MQPGKYDQISVKYLILSTGEKMMIIDIYSSLKCCDMVAMEVYSRFDHENKVIVIEVVGEIRIPDFSRIIDIMKRETTSWRSNKIIFDIRKAKKRFDILDYVEVAKIGTRRGIDDHYIMAGISNEEELDGVFFEKMANFEGQIFKAVYSYEEAIEYLSTM